MAIEVNVKHDGECGQTPLTELLGISKARLDTLQSEAYLALNARRIKNKGKVTSSDVIEVAAQVADNTEEYTMALLALYGNTFGLGRHSEDEKEVESES